MSFTLAVKIFAKRFAVLFPGLIVFERKFHRRRSIFGRDFNNRCAKHCFIFGNSSTEQNFVMRGENSVQFFGSAMKTDRGNMMLSAGIWATAGLDGNVIEILGGLKSAFHFRVQFLYQSTGSRDAEVAGF